MRSISVFFIIAALSSIFYPLLSFNPVFAQATNEERALLERQLAELESQIAQHEATITEYQKQGKTLQGEIGNLNAKINKLNLQIKAVTLSLVKLDKEISETKSQIKTTEEKIDLNKEALRRAIWAVYESDRQGLMAVLLNSRTLSDFVGDVNNLVKLQKTLTVTVNTITDLRNQLVKEKENLEEKRDDAAALKSIQDNQRLSLQSVRTDKNQLLAVTKGRESKFQATLKETKKTAAEIRRRIFQFFGGGEMSFEEAYQLAKLASQATGVRTAFILAILDKESALGQNVGRCSYEKAMHPIRDLPLFLALIVKLKEAGTAPPEPIMVSCPNRDGAYGGAMGPAQFIPSTWNLYGARVSELTGHNPASPWNNGDAIMGTAVYMKDLLNTCANTDGLSGLAQERCAAGRYYAGRRWRTYQWTYGDRAVTKAQQFQQDIDILNS